MSKKNIYKYYLSEYDKTNIRSENSDYAQCLYCLLDNKSPNEYIYIFYNEQGCFPLINPLFCKTHISALKTFPSKKDFDIFDVLYERWKILKSDMGHREDNEDVFNKIREIYGSN